MTLRDWQTGKGCCLDSIRGQLPLHGPVLNKVPINSPFISDRNQCTGDGVSQLTLLIAWSRRKRRREVEVDVGETGSKKTIWERIAENEPQRQESGMYLWRERTGFPPSEMPHGSAAVETLTESRADCLPGGSVHAVLVVGGEEEEGG